MKNTTELPDKINVIAFIFVPRINSFLMFVSLQGGISIITCFYCVGAMCSIKANMTMLDPLMPLSCVLIASLNIFIIVTWIIAISGSFGEKKLLVKIALVMWSVFVGIWLFCVSFTFTKFDTQILCLDHRCPESFWVYNNTYYKMVSLKPIMKPLTTPMALVIPLKMDGAFTKSFQRYLDSKTELYLKMKENEIISVKEKNQNDLIGLVDEETTGDELTGVTMPQNGTTEEELDPVFDFWTNNTTGFIISILMITVNFIIMMYSWLVLFGHYAEMICIENCVCNNGESTSL